MPGILYHVSSRTLDLGIPELTTSKGPHTPYTISSPSNNEKYKS
jgi:hypothetical protein